MQIFETKPSLWKAISFKRHELVKWKNGGQLVCTTYCSLGRGTKSQLTPLPTIPTFPYHLAQIQQQLFRRWPSPIHTSGSETWSCQATKAEPRRALSWPLLHHEPEGTVEGVCVNTFGWGHFNFSKCFIHQSKTYRATRPPRDLTPPPRNLSLLADRWKNRWVGTQLAQRREKPPG